DPQEWDYPGLKAWLATNFGVEWTIPIEEVRSHENLNDRVKEAIEKATSNRQEKLGPEAFNELMRNVLLSVMDGVWVEHLTYLEQLRRGIFLRAYAQKEPLREFQKEGFRLFEGMMMRVRDTSLEFIFMMSEAAAAHSSHEQNLSPVPLVYEKSDGQGGSVAQTVQNKKPAPEKPSGV